MEVEELKKIDKPICVAVYKKNIKSKTSYMVVTLKSIDIVNNAIAKKPIIDHKCDIIELGIGTSLIDKWKAKYNIKKYKFVSR